MKTVKVRVAVIVIGIMILGGVCYHLAGKPSERPAIAAPANIIVARARIEPAGRVHLVSGPSGGGTIADLKVREGDRVRAGQVLAVLDSFASAEAALRTAEQQVKVAKLERQRVSAGAKPADISAQSAQVEARIAELQRAQSQFERAKKLNDSRFISTDQFEERALAVRRAQEAVNVARSTLRAMTETRPIDDRIAAAKIAEAEARLAAAAAERDRAIVRAPIDGTVLTIFARTGAALAEQGLLTLGNVDRPIAIAEIDEMVAARVRPGQPAEITLRGDGHTLRGRVTRVMRDVDRSGRPTSDVLTGRDARIVEAEIEFVRGQRQPSLVGQEATVRLDAGSGTPK